MTDLNAAAARVAGSLRTRRGGTVAALVLITALALVLSATHHHSRPTGAAVVPVLSVAPPTHPAAAPGTSPSIGTTASPSATGTGDDTTVGDDGFAAATITSGPADPRDAGVAWLTKYLNTQGSDQEWIRNVTVGDDGGPLVTADLAGQLAQVDKTRVPVGIVDLSSRPPTWQATGDFQVQVTVRLVADRNHLDREVATLFVWLDGSSHRWLVSQLDESKPAATP